MKLVFATGNSKKMSEVRALIDDSVDLLQVDLDVDEIQEVSLKKISEYKARKAFEILKKPLIVEDAGVYFDEYADFPGAFAKFMFKSLGFEWFRKLLKGVRNLNWKMVAVTSYIEPWMQEVKQFVGEVQWKIDFSFLTDDADPRIPYNNIFVPEWYNKPVFQMYEEWTKFNHRANAVRLLNEYLVSKK